MDLKIVSILCGILVFFNTALAETNGKAEEKQEAGISAVKSFGADNATAETVKIGSTDKESGYEFELELSSKGAGISNATFSKFTNGDRKNTKPLNILMPAGPNVFSMANGYFVFTDYGQRLPLDKLDWKNMGVEKSRDESETVRFETVLKDKDNDKPVIKLVKTFKISQKSFLIDCTLHIENLSLDKQKVQFDLTGPAGITSEEVNGDMRKVVAGFRNAKGEITSTRIDITKFDGEKTFDEKQLINGEDKFLWASVVDKYFAAIVVPVPQEGKEYCDWISDKTGWLYNPDGKKTSGDENIGVSLKTTAIAIEPAGQRDSTKEYKFNLYIGPKDKPIFDKNEYYKNLGFVQTIDFAGCCCPAAMIAPLAFGILSIMNWMYGFIPNYGIVIIIFVFLVRLILHPLTKKSQVSMSGMSKLAPRAEEIKTKYANNKAEMQKQLMALYREQGVTPIMGMIPMFIQMPIWIALYSAINNSIALRGSAFLPFWITDLSAPDALIKFATVTIPLVGWTLNSLNLLPLLMGVAFYLQQKLTPMQSGAATNPQMAQQQKMMAIMMPLMFPLMLYKAPSGLNLYIMASTFAGVIEQYVIKKHIQEKEQAEEQGLVSATSKTGGKVKKKKPKPFFKNT